jgi:hypothetical protein
MGGFCKTGIKLISLVLRQQSQMIMVHDFMYEIIKERKIHSLHIIDISLYAIHHIAYKSLPILYTSATILYCNTYIKIPLLNFSLRI